MRRYKQSAEWLARARAVTPGGAQTLSKRAERFPEGAFPAVLQGAKGSHAWDVDGHDYVDWVCALGAVTLGYDYPLGLPDVEPSLSLPTTQEVVTAEQFLQIVPWAEQVRFVKTGSEATEAAIRIARRATGRNLICTVATGYHSWHSWFQAVKPQHPGVPDEYAQLASGFRYNDFKDFDLAFQGGRDVAAVIMEPCLIDRPDPKWLLYVLTQCRTHGALLIFDEMVCGFRWARAGGSEYFGVTPDLATYGKGMGNGFPIACVVGKRGLMQYADVVSGTFGGEALSLAACGAVLDAYEREPVIAHLWRVGGLFQDGLNKLLAHYELPGIVEGYPVHPRLRWTVSAPQYLELRDVPSPDDTVAQKADLNRRLMSLWLQEMAAGGVLVHPSGWNVSYAHTTEDVTWSLDAADRAFVACKWALATGDWSSLKGNLIEENLFRPVPS